MEIKIIDLKATKYKKISFRYFPFTLVLISYTILGFIIFYWLKNHDLNVINIILFIICVLIVITRKGIQFSQTDYSEYFNFILLKITYNKNLLKKVRVIYLDKVYRSTVALVVSIRRYEGQAIKSFLYVLRVSDEINDDKVLFKSLKFDKTIKVANMLSGIIGLPIKERYIKIFYPRIKKNSDDIKEPKIIIQEKKIFEGEIDVERKFIMKNKIKNRIKNKKK